MVQLDDDHPQCGSRDYKNTQCTRALGHRGACDYLPAPTRDIMVGSIPRFSADEPRQALHTLDQIFRGGNQKHGHFDWKTHRADEFILKAQRHFGKHILLNSPLDTDSGHPHLVHSAANLLLATELGGWKKQ